MLVLRALTLPIAALTYCFLYAVTNKAPYFSQNVVIFAWIGLPLLLLYYTVKNRKRRKKKHEA